MIIGVVLVILGLGFLLKNLGVLTEVTWSFVWPVLAIIFGLIFIFRRKKW